jgi:hypothetical protein
MRAMCDSPLAGNFGYLYEYEAPQVTGILSREVFRLHRLLEYIDGDRDSIFSRCSLAGAKHISRHIVDS